ncbi:hypothetical protein [Methanobacterium sp.]|uniref:hypothetical protein n=1 Tax=Methanobacterium sp. TaxID=2164 RepID=UPI002ABB4042|nr:hypothetical protein [Methanobacterium sp.]MDY9924397.1 hypothetical protein [Methanobacterium sp.]
MVKIFITNSKPLDQHTNSIRLLRADHFNDNEFYWQLLFAILSQKDIEKDDIEEINLEIYGDDSSHQEKLIDYMSARLEVDKNELLEVFE